MRSLFHFLGVTTAQSSMVQVFPAWMAELGRSDVQLCGVDLPLRGDPQLYRDAVLAIANDDSALGGLVTTHKVDVYAAAHDLFAFLDHYARRGREVSSISKRGDALAGHAKDPISCGRSLHDFLGEDYFAGSDAEVLCLGAGGSAAAIALYFQDRERGQDRPRRLHLVDRVPMRTHVPSAPIEVVFHQHATARQNDELMGSLPPRSIVVNATGMGKDLPGSPITDAAIFPEQAVVWELNYRGEREFLQQAQAQRDRRQLQVQDGWACFLYGWTEVIAEILHIDIDAECFARLRRTAEVVTGRQATYAGSAP